MADPLLPGILLGRAVCGDLEQAERREWWLSNGLGGYAAAKARLLAEGVERGPGRLKARWVGFEGFDATLWMENLAGAQLLVEMSGAEHVRLLRVHGGLDGDSEMVAEARWR